MMWIPIKLVEQNSSVFHWLMLNTSTNVEIHRLEKNLLISNDLLLHQQRIKKIFPRVEQYPFQVNKRERGLME